MPVDVIVGLQYGSEGKGAIAQRIADMYDGAIRVGAPNAGHTIYKDGVEYKMRQIPCAWINPHCRLFVGPGGLINKEVLDKELAMLPMNISNRFRIDSRAGLVEEKDIRFESNEGFNTFNGSTSEGIGAAQARKVLRKHGSTVGQDEDLKQYAGNVTREVQLMLECDQDIMIEGTQGYGLSLNHGPYPYVTSRDVLAASLLSDSGLAPADCRYVFGVMRTYPIRVAGNSGPMGGKELTWQDVANRAGYEGLEERTTVTKRVRRVSEIDWDLLLDAVRSNRPTGIFVMFADYIDAKSRGARSLADMPEATRDRVMGWVLEAERNLRVPILGLSTGPMPEDWIQMDAWKDLWVNKPGKVVR